MATVNLAAGDKTASGSLTASTVETINFNVFVSKLRIVADGTSAVDYTIDGSTPTLAGANTTRLPAGSASVDEINLLPGQGRNPVVKLFSAGTGAYSVSSVQ